MAVKGVGEEAKPRVRCYGLLIPIFVLLGAFLIFFTIFITPKIIESMIETQVLLTPGTLSYEQWRKPTPLVYKIVTVYNITNEAEVQAGGQPVLTAIGPYYFREYREKINVTNNSILTFQEKKWYVFDNFTTNVNRSDILDPVKDNFTTINIPYVGVAYNLSLSNAGTSKFLEAMSLAAMEGEDYLFMTRSVNDVIFGFKDPFLTALSVFMPGLPTTVQCVYNMSTTDMTEVSKVESGKDNITQLGQYRQWQGYTTLPYWNSPQANTINGTEGFFFKPGLKNTDTLSIWADDMFRSIVMEFDSEEMKLGLHTYKYRTPAYGMLNATSNPDNAGFYSYCPDGLMNLTSPVNAPVMLSKPSFLGGAPWLVGEVTGLDPPNITTMDTNIWVEPTTGVLVSARKQLQINVMVSKPTKYLINLNKLRDSPRFIPLALVQETGGLDDDLLATFKNKVFTPQIIMADVLWVCVAACFLISLILAGLLAKRLWVPGEETSEGKPLLTN